MEGKDFQILGKYARKLGAAAISSRRDFAVVPVEGFSPERIRSLKRGIEMTLGVKIVAGAKLDEITEVMKSVSTSSESAKNFVTRLSYYSEKRSKIYLSSSSY